MADDAAAMARFPVRVDGGGVGGCGGDRPGSELRSKRVVGSLGGGGVSVETTRWEGGPGRHREIYRARPTARGEVGAWNLVMDRGVNARGSK